MPSSDLNSPCSPISQTTYLVLPLIMAGGCGSSRESCLPSSFWRWRANSPCCKATWPGCKACRGAAAGDLQRRPPLFVGRVVGCAVAQCVAVARGAQHRAGLGPGRAAGHTSRGRPDAAGADSRPPDTKLRRSARRCAPPYPWLKLVAFGIVPGAPVTGYGYIRRCTPVAGGGFGVAAFVEKPALALAQRYVASGVLEEQRYVLLSGQPLPARAGHTPPRLIGRLQQRKGPAPDRRGLCAR